MLWIGSKVLPDAPVSRVFRCHSIPLRLKSMSMGTTLEWPGRTAAFDENFQHTPRTPCSLQANLSASFRPEGHVLPSWTQLTRLLGAISPLMVALLPPEGCTHRRAAESWIWSDVPSRLPRMVARAASPQDGRNRKMGYACQERLKYGNSHYAQFDEGSMNTVHRCNHLLNGCQIGVGSGSLIENKTFWDLESTRMAQGHVCRDPLFSLNSLPQTGRGDAVVTEASCNPAFVGNLLRPRGR
jgi:hypothetical protein